MKSILTPLALIAGLFLVSIADSHAGDYEKPDVDDVCNKFLNDCPTDTDTDSTKNLNGRVGQAAVLGSVLDSRISTPGERINLDLNWSTNDFGGPGAAGGAVMFNLPEVHDNLYVGLRGGHSFEGAGTIVGVGASFAFSPF